MDAISYSYADKQAKRIKKIINDPDSTSGIVTVPKVIASGESVTIPAGRMAVLPNVQVDGTLNIQGDVFIPAGATFADLSTTKADLTYVNNKYVGFKNYIINGGFTVWQRGTSFTFNIQGAPGFTADRWFISQLGYGGTQGVTIQSAAYAGKNSTSLKSIQTTACNNKVIQIIENTGLGQFIRGKKATVSFWYKAKGGLVCELRESATEIASLQFDTVNTVGTISGYSTGIIADETWRKCSFTTSSELGQNAYLYLVFYNNSILAGNYFEIAEVQLEEGSVATPFEVRPYALELMLCQRYYQRFVHNMANGELYSHERVHATGDVVFVTKTIPFKVPMRTYPTITIPRVYNNGVDYDTGWYVYSSGVNNGYGGICIYKVCTVTNNSIIAFDAIADAEL